MSQDANAQMRAHLPSSVLMRWRYVIAKLRGVKLAPSVSIFSKAKLLRYPRNISLGKSAVIKSGAHICPCNANAIISIGDRTTIGFYTFIYASSTISIGHDCMIAPFVYMVDSDHGIQAGLPMNSQANKSKPIHIGDDVWIGAHSVILAGITVGSGSIVAAGAVVRENVQPNTIVGGVPASVIGVRK